MAGWVDDLLGIKTVQEDGVDRPSRAKINIIGATVADNPTTKTTDITIVGGGGGGGDVDGPVSSTDNAVARWNGASGGVVQDSLVTIDDVGNVSVPANRTVDGRDLSTDGAILDTHVASTSNPHSVTAAQVGAVPTARSVNTGTGLSGGGDLSIDRTIELVAATTSDIGGMSASDKTKLDAIDPNATANVISSDDPQPLGTADAGATGEVADAGHVHAHGNQSGGALHAVASIAAAGFMSQADKSKLDGIQANADATTISGAAPQPLGTAAAGGSGNVSDAAHVHAHGDQGGGTQHDEATTSVAGFMSAADKTKLDAVDPGATANDISGSTPQAVGATGSAGSTGDVSDAGHVHAHGDQAGGSLHALATSGAHGFLSAADKAKLDTVASGATATPISGSAAQTVGTSNSAGSTGQAADAGHIHSHGNQAGGSLHAVATSGAAGFLSAADKVDLDAIKGGFRGLNIQVVTEYTPVLGDAGQLVGLAHGADIDVTFPPNTDVAFPNRTATGGATVLSFLQLGGGEINFLEGAGVSVIVPAGRGARTKGPGAIVQAVKAGLNGWYLSGDLVEAFDEGQQFETIVARFTTTQANAPSTAAVTIAPNTVFGANQTILLNAEVVVRADGVNSSGLEEPTYGAATMLLGAHVVNTSQFGSFSFVSSTKPTPIVGDGPFDADLGALFQVDGNLNLSVIHPATLVGTAEWSIRITAHALQTSPPADFS